MSVGGLKAAQQFVESGEHLPGQLRRNGVLVLAAFGEDGGQACLSGRENNRSADSSMSRAAKTGRPAISVILPPEGQMSGCLAARGIDEPKLRTVAERPIGTCVSRSRRPNRPPGGWRPIAELCRRSPGYYVGK